MPRAGLERVGKVNPTRKRLNPVGRCAATGKHQWEDRRGAKQHRASLLASGKQGVTRDLTEYRCPICQFWHVGHRQKRG